MASTTYLSSSDHSIVKIAGIDKVARKSPSLQRLGGEMSAVSRWRVIISDKA